MVLTSLLLLPVVHYIADFELQNNWMALGKSKRLLPLICHVGVYSLCFALVFGWQFGCITFVCHFVTDFLTSRWTSKLWFFKDSGMGGDDPKVWPHRPLWVYVDGKRHRFFCVIGLDQMIHAYTLMFSVIYFNAKPVWL